MRDLKHTLSLTFSAPNQRVERTAAERLAFDTAGFMNIIGHSLGALSAAVAHSGRWADKGHVNTCNRSIR